jgi:NTP pyrophosphatase (non-canonical NTP hydrolase)
VEGDMTLNQYQQLAMRTNTPQRNTLEAITNAVMGMAGEAGELVDYVKKVRYQGHRLDQQQLIEEAGDVLWYVAQLATALADYSGPVMLSDVAEYNIAKLKRRYPDGFKVERSIHRK